MLYERKLFIEEHVHSMDELEGIETTSEVTGNSFVATTK